MYHERKTPKKGTEMDTEIRMLDDGNGVGSIWDYFQKEPVASGQEIAEELGYTRANVSRILKKIFGDTYLMVSRQDPEKTPFEIAIYISKMFGVDFSIEMEVKKFFRLFPPGLKKLIEEDGTARMESGIRRLSLMR